MYVEYAPGLFIICQNMLEDNLTLENYSYSDVFEIVGMVVLEFPFTSAFMAAIVLIPFIILGIYHILVHKLPMKWTTKCCMRERYDSEKRTTKAKREAKQFENWLVKQQQQPPTKKDVKVN